MNGAFGKREFKLSVRMFLIFLRIKPEKIFLKIYKLNHKN
jgi:hypothetical protein